MIERRYDLPGPAHTNSGQPQAIICGDFVFFAALRGVDERGTVPDDVDTQCALLVDLLRRQLAALGLGMEHVVKAGLYFKDLAGVRPVLNHHWTMAFGASGPVRFGVEVSDIGGPGDATQVLADVVAFRGGASVGEGGKQ